MSRTSIALTAVLLAFLGCSSGPTVDASTPESSQKSIEEVSAALPEAKRQEFSSAIAIVITNALGGGYKDVGDTPEGRARVRAALQGKTADEIIAAAAQIRQDAAKAKKS